MTERRTGRRRRRGRARGHGQPRLLLLARRDVDVRAQRVAAVVELENLIVDG